MKDRVKRGIKFHLCVAEGNGQGNSNADGVGNGITTSAVGHGIPCDVVLGDNRGAVKLVGGDGCSRLRTGFNEECDLSKRKGGVEVVGATSTSQIEITG